MKRSLTLFLAMLMASALVLSACGNSGASSSAGSVSGSAAGSQESEAWHSDYYDAKTMTGKTINLYGVTDAIVPALDEFTKDTGIQVENLTLKNGEILQRVTNEYQSGNVIADVWFTGGADAFISAASQGLLEAYKSPEAESIPDDMKDTDGYWTGTSLTVVDWVVNKSVIKDLGIEMPTSWDDLLQPQLKGWISMPDPSSSGTGYNTVSAILQTRGEADGWTYLEQLIGQVPYFTARGSDPQNNVIAGEAAVGINAGTGQAALEGYDDISVVYPKDGTGWWPQPVAVMNGCKNPDEAKVFVDWLLSDRGLEEVGKAQDAMLVKDSVPTPEGLMSLSQISLFPTDFKANAAQRDSILTQWAAKVSAAGK